MQSEKPATREWVDGLPRLSNGDVRVEVVAINKFYDGIEVWQEPETADAILALHKYPITQGDVRLLCLALHVRCP